MYLSSRVAPILGGVSCALAMLACSSSETGDRAIGLGSQLVVSIAPKTDTLIAGATRQMSVAITDGSGVAKNAAVTWSSSSPAVASVSGSGLVSAIAPGVAHIVVRTSAEADSATVVVRANNQAFSVEPSIVSIPFGERLQLSITSSSQSKIQYTTSNVTWSSSDSSIAVVDESGIVTTTGVGDVTLTARSGDAASSAFASVKQNAIGSIRISPTNSSINAKTSEKLVATLYDDNGRVLPGTVTSWSTSSMTTATVGPDGTVTGMAKGSAIITARVGPKRATATVTILDIAAGSIEVTAPSTTVAAGQTLQATATVKDADGNVLTGRVIAWQSSNPALATVNASGLITGVAPGNVTISAISDGKIGNLAVTVGQKPVASVAITPANGSAMLGQSAQLSASARDASGGAITGKTFTWQSSNPSVGTISATGLLTTTAIGTTTITATTDGVSGTTGFTVTSVPVASVTVAPTTVSLTVGGSKQMSFSGTDANGGSLTNRVVQWTSTNPTIATVSSSGMVTAVGKGSTSIKATVDGVSGTAQAAVSDPAPAPVATVAVSLAAGSLTAGQTTQATATLRDADGNVLAGRTVTWSSTDPDLATVSSTGVVTAVAAGTATIVATSEGQTGSASLTITPPAPTPVASVSLSAPSTALVVGQTTQVTVVVRDATGHVLTGRIISWRSTASGVASVNANGVVTAIANGTTSIEATSEGVTGSLSIGVSGGGPGPVASISVVASATSLTVGQATQATATARDASGTVIPNATFSWTSSNSAVLGVSGSGVATGVAAGTAQVRATIGSIVGSLGITVTAPAPPPPPPPPGQLPVVPGLYGFGTTTPAGRGGQVIRVTNLNDNGTGSLRAALQTSGARVVIFDVSGTITLSSKIAVSSPYLTLAGQTAPAPGITLKGAGISIRTHDVLIQHMRFRTGVTGVGNNDGVEILGPGGYNVVVDHISASWSGDENGSTWYGGAHDITFANALFSENLGSGAVLVGDSTKNMLIVNTAFISNQDRNPYFKGFTTGLMANSLVYNWGGNQAFYTADPEGSGPTQVAVVGNVFIRGPSTPSGRPIQFYSSSKAGSKMYVASNIEGRGSSIPTDQWSLVKNDFGSAGIATSAPVWPTGLTVASPSEVYATATTNAGAWPASRDAVDARLVDDLKNGTGKIVTTDGPWPTLPVITRALTLPSNPNGDDNGNGYTNLEEWLQALARAAEGK